MAFYYDEYKSFLFYQIFMANYFESTLVYDDDEFIREKHLPPTIFFHPTFDECLSWTILSTRFEGFELKKNLLPIIKITNSP